MCKMSRGSGSRPRTASRVKGVPRCGAFGAQEEGLLGGARVGLLHGRLGGDEKAAALAAFASGETPVLIATTVIEARD